jgi:putative endonuclease
MKTYYVYMMASKKNGTLYTGMTNDLIKRVYEHKEGVVEGFTKKYGVKILVWYEQTNDVEAAIKREKNIQAWKREWKLRLIEEKNPSWSDLYNEIIGCQPALA